ncbi:MAG TPA: Sua5/YciO/YrdC/YwlC family protein [Chloroflexota bacterium]|nr:Sua5/YciO/YrdC/YwlC family protein [Chloroflexota bacterium]
MKESVEAYRVAAEYLEAGKLVAIPGATNYAFVLNALDDRAIDRVYTIKGRSHQKPLTLLLPPHDVECHVLVPDAVRPVLCLMGDPIAFVGRAKPGSELVQRINPHGSTIGFFWLNIPLHKYLYALTKCPIAGTSLNHSDRPMVRNGDDAVREFGELVDLVIDGGEVAFPTEQSTVLDFSVDPVQVLRQGVVGEAELRWYLPASGVKLDARGNRA